MTIAFLIGLGLYAQENVPASPPPESPAVQAPDEPAPLPPVKDTPLQAMIRTFDRIRLERLENADRLDNIQRQMQELLRQPTANAFATKASAIRRDLHELQGRLQVERENQITFKNEIDRFSADRQLLRQEASYLSHYLDELKLYGLEQEKAIKLIQNIHTAVAVRLDRLPPPPEFTNRLGMSFVLVQAKGQAPFYVSSQVMTQEQYLAALKLLTPDRQEAELSTEAERAFREGMTHAEAQRLALGIAHLSGSRVTLPSAKEIAALNSVDFGKDLERAVWLQEKWGAPYDEREAIVRFGATMVAIWDPAGILARHGGSDQTAVVGELPNAHYPGLGCIFVAPVMAGKAARLAQAEENIAADSNLQEEQK
ncbi:MAG: hypothetical protein IKR13_04295 [Victivallales bacterium]|nr:hypothetical protein [Victivallales bacterium]